MMTMVCLNIVPRRHLGTDLNIKGVSVHSDPQSRRGCRLLPAGAPGDPTKSVWNDPASVLASARIGWDGNFILAIHHLESANWFSCTPVHRTEYMPQN